MKLHHKFSLNYLLVGLLTALAAPTHLFCQAPAFALPGGETAPEDDADQAFLSADDADEEEAVYVLPDFVVSSEQDSGYYSANSTSVSRTNSLVKDTPISLSIINEQLIDDLNIVSIEDLALVNASIDEDPNGFSLDRIRIRGFRSAFSRFNFFRRNLPGDNYNVARVDVIKGANSLIFGQASPGGTVNSVPLLANFKDNSQTFTGLVGNKDYYRGVFNVNQILSDNIAVRLMGVHHEQGYDHPLKSNELDAITLAATINLSDRTQVRLHIEGADTLNRFPTRAMRDRTEIDDIDDDILIDTTPNASSVLLGPAVGYQGILNQADFADSITNYEVPFSPDWVKYLPQQAIDWIIDNTKDNDVPITSRQQLEDHYSAINSENYGSVSGPDSFSQRDGVFFMADVDHKFSDNLNFNLSLNFQGVHSEGLRRDSDGAVRVRDSYDTNIFGSNPRPKVEVEEHIRTYWTQSDIQTDRFASRSALVYESEWFNIENKFILGWDFTLQNRDEAFYDQVPVGAIGALLPNGTQLADGAYIPIGRSSGNSINGLFRAYEYVATNRPTIGRSIHRFNTIIESDINGLGVLSASDALIGTTAYADPTITDAEWGLNRTTQSDVNSNSFWAASQNKFFDGRLHTLFGVRYDYITVDSAFRRVLFHGYDTGNDDGNNNESSVTYDQLNPSLGGLFWLSDSLALFGNYAQSIELPSGTERTPIGEIAPPELGEGYEGGIRFDLFDGVLDGQCTYYSITKENDSEFAYSDRLLRDIYTFGEYGESHPELFNNNNNLITRNLPGRRGVGDKTRSDGVELDLTYNPLPGLSFIASYNHTLANEIEELDPAVENPEQFELFGRPDHRASLTGRYEFKDGVLKGLTVGASQRFRSATVATRLVLGYDDDGNQKIDRIERVYLKFGDEHTTTAFVSWKKKLGKQRGSPKLALSFRVNNLFDNTDFTGRENYGFYRESRSYNLSAKLLF